MSTIRKPPSSLGWRVASWGLVACRVVESKELLYFFRSVTFIALVRGMSLHARASSTTSLQEGTSISLHLVLPLLEAASGDSMEHHQHDVRRLSFDGDLVVAVTS